MNMKKKSFGHSRPFFAIFGWKWPSLGFLRNTSTRRSWILMNKCIPNNWNLFRINMKKLGILAIQVNFWAIFNKKLLFSVFLAMNPLILSRNYESINKNSKNSHFSTKNGQKWPLMANIPKFFISIQYDYALQVSS